jgi:hypothetical protein
MLADAHQLRLRETVEDQNLLGHRLTSNAKGETVADPALCNSCFQATV